VRVKVARDQCEKEDENEIRKREKRRKAGEKYKETDMAQEKSKRGIELRVVVEELMSNNM
jgi:hypothetical protein